MWVNAHEVPRFYPNAVTLTPGDAAVAGQLDNISILLQSNLPGRWAVKDSFMALDHMLRRFTRIVAGMVVYPERMRANLELSRGVVFSGTVLLELARRGVSREQAYEWVQRNAMRAFHEQRPFKDLLLADADVTKVLPPQDIERAFSLDEQLKHVDDIFGRVFVQQEVHA